MSSSTVIRDRFTFAIVISGAKAAIGFDEQIFGAE
jgi:hypothetical protein